MVGGVGAVVVDSAPVAVAVAFCSSLVHAAATRLNTAATTTAIRIQPSRNEKRFRNSLSRVRISRLYDQRQVPSASRARLEISSNQPLGAVITPFQRPGAFSHRPPEPTQASYPWDQRHISPETTYGS